MVKIFKPYERARRSLQNLITKQDGSNEVQIRARAALESSLALVESLQLEVQVRPVCRLPDMIGLAGYDR